MPGSGNMVSMRVFISYRDEDRELAHLIARYLSERKVPVWLDRDSIRPGDAIAEEIVGAMKASDAVVFIVSKAAGRGTWMNHEMGLALAEGDKRIVPVLAEPGAELPFLLKGYSALDLSTSERLAKNLPRLVDALAAPIPRRDAQAVKELIEAERRMFQWEADHLARKRSNSLALSIAAFIAVLTGLLSVVLFGSAPSDKWVVGAVAIGVAGLVNAAVVVHYTWRAEKESKRTAERAREILLDEIRRRGRDA